MAAGPSSARLCRSRAPTREVIAASSPLRWENAAADEAAQGVGVGPSCAQRPRPSTPPRSCEERGLIELDGFLRTHVLKVSEAPLDVSPGCKDGAGYAFAA